ncbi:MAG: PD-(D/E)XK nuclease family protein [bacterium]|nr:PD-(D/E)XK nuclease family protein [bacterium]
MKKLLLFPFNRKDKTDILIQQFIKEPLETLYITPHVSKINDFKIRYYRNRQKNPLLPSTHTIKTLALNILNSESEKRVISDVEKYIVILEMLKDHKIEERFRYTPPGMALAIANFIKDVKISTEDISLSFKTIKEKINSFDWKFGYNCSIVLFAFDIMERYTEYMKKNNLLDMEDIYKEAVDYVRYLKFKELVFEGFCEIPYYQRRFVSNLIDNIPSVVFSFPYDENVSIDVKELILNNTYSWLKKLTQWKEDIYQKENRQPEVECYNFSTQAEEVEGIVSIIGKELEKHPDWTLNDIMTVFPSMPSYRPIVQRVFKRYNLPSEILPGYSLNQDTSISTLLEFFVFKETYDWGTLMNILTCPYFSKLDIRATEKFSIDTREKFSRVGFVRDDFNLLRGKNIDIVGKIIKRIEGSPKSLKEWVQDIEFIIEKLGWQPGYSEIRTRFQKLLYEIKRDIFFSEDEFVNILKKALELVEVEEGRGSGVKVSGVQESVGMSKKLCIVGGATDENIPSAPSLEELFIPDTLKKQMGFTSYDLRMARERLDLYRLKNENDKIIFTYPSKIGDKNQMKSIFLFDLQDSTPAPNIFISKASEIFAPSFSKEKFIKKFVRDGKLNIRVTQLESLLKCSYSFYLKEVEEIEPYQLPEVAEVPELWGSIIHRVMDDIFKDYKNKIIMDEDVVVLIKLFNERMIEEIGKECKEQKISNLYKNIMIKRSEEVNGKFTSIIKAHTGNIFVDSEHKIEEGTGLLHLRGRIDRIEKTPDNRLNIIDIKTGTTPPPSYTENNFFNGYNLQIPLYIWMYSKKFNISPEDITGNIWRFDFIEKEGKDSDYEKYYKKIDYFEKIEGFLDNVAIKVLEENFSFIPEEPLNCYFCCYKGLCPYERD